MILYAHLLLNIKPTTFRRLCTNCINSTQKSDNKLKLDNMIHDFFFIAKKLAMHSKISLKKINGAEDFFI